jgi:lipopolysaccharide O-acetyltransferase
LIIGRDVQINDYVHIAAISSVTIGDRVLIASKVLITDHNHGIYKGPTGHSNPNVPPAEREEAFAPVRIEDDVWIGEFVSVLPGVSIGKGAVIGTMSTVTRDVPAYTMAAGSPARLIKRFNFDTSLWEAI